MLTLFKWLMWIAVGLGLLILLALAGVYYMASHSLPDYNAERQLDGITGEVTIVRDSFAVPHIFAEHDADVFFGLGYAHAQDRLWQMTMFRRIAQGRLAEVFGPDLVERDYFLRSLDIYRSAVRSAGHQSAETLAELEAYSRGVNARLQLVREEALGRGAPEFFLFEPRIAPWTPADSIAVQKLLALMLSDGAINEFLRAALLNRMPPERVRDLMPLPPNALIALPEYAGLNMDIGPAPEVPLREIAALPQRGLAGASNVFAADGSRAAAGASLLASDPHLSLTAPGYMYLARLELDTGGVIGATIPGLPAVLIGRNQQIGWGLTSSYLDDQDIYIERLDLEKEGNYLTPEGSRSFESRETIIAVDGAAPVTRTVRATRHGPVIRPEQFGLPPLEIEGHAFALAWTGLNERDQSIATALKLMRAQTIKEATEAGRTHVAPSLNLAIAERDRVALIATGAAPARKPGSSSQGRIPSLGWLAENDWDGMLPYDGNPGVTDPLGGIVVNTNNRITDDAYPEHWSFDWGDAHRIDRAEKLLNGRAFHTLDSFVEIQTDTVSSSARSLLPLIARNLWFQGEAAAEGTVERRRQIALEALAAWNGEMDEHAPEPLIFAAWIRELQQRLIRDELGPLAASFPRAEPLFLERVFRDVEGASAWCDIRPSDRVESCEEAARIALDAALLYLVETHGERLESWRWGQVHQARHRHEVLGDLGMFRWLVNIVQDTPGGDSTLLRGRSTGRGEEPFLNVHGAVFRAVYDFADPDSSVYIASTGQSGHVLSRHYDDMSLLWRRGEYIQMSLDPELARGGAVGITRLLPRP